MMSDDHHMGDHEGRDHDHDMEAHSTDDDDDDSTDTPLKQEDEETQRQRHLCLVSLLIIVALLAITAIVLPLVLDTCKCEAPAVLDTSGGVQQRAETVAPVAPPVAVPVATSPPTPQPTAPPTSAPTLTRLSKLIQNFLEPLSGPEVFESTSSPQYKAAVFLAEEDVVGPKLEGTPELADRYALIVFYFALDGDNWFSCFASHDKCPGNAVWLDPNKSHCDWNSVSCNDEGRVTDIFFDNPEGNGLFGRFPNEMSLLIELKNLVAVNNLIEGNFPATFAALDKLETIILVNNRLSGALAENLFINSAGTLQNLLLTNNTGITGKIPTSFGSLTALRRLSLSNCGLIGGIPTSLGNLNDLSLLDFSFNNLDGNFPSTLYNLAKVELLFVNNNPSLSGSLLGNGNGVSQWTMLTELRVGSTAMGGQIPDSLWGLPKIVEFDATGASFTGPLTEQVGTAAGSLRRLFLANNEMSGILPVALDSMVLLNEVRLEGNSFAGTISQAVCNRRGTGFNQISVLSADCNSEVTCSCCTACF